MRWHWMVGISVCVASAASAQDAAPPPVAKPDAAPSTTVVVTAKTPPVVHKIDRNVYDVKAMPQGETGTLGDVLNVLPSVNVAPDGSSVTVRGASVLILIDGKPSATLRGANLAATLQSLPASTIDKIEVITNPGAEFRTDAQTVINIITRKVRGPKPMGVLVASTDGQNGRFRTNLSGSAGIGKWTFNGAAAVSQDKHNWTTTFDRSALDPSDGALISHMLGSQLYLAHNVAQSLDGGATYAPSDKDSLTLSGHVSTFRADRSNDDPVVFLDASGQPQSDPTTVSSALFTFDDGSLTGTWKHQGRRDGETFTLVARHEESEIFDGQTYHETQDLPTPSSDAYGRTRTERDLADELSGDYVLPLATDTQLKAGFDIERDQGQSYYLATNIDPVTGTATLDPTLTNRFLADQTLSAAYIDYQHPLGKWLVEGGLRVENLTTTLGASRGALAPTAANLEWSPSLFLSRDLTPHQKIKFTYSRRIDHPAVQQLNAAPIQSDPQDIFVGNPSLKPAQTDSFEAGYDYTTKPITFSGTAYLRQTHDSITGYSYYSSPSDAVLVDSLENAGSSSRAGLDMSLDLHPSPKIAYSLNSDIFDARQDTPVDGVPVERSILSHLSKASITLTPWSKDQFQISALVLGRNLLADGYVEGVSSFDLAYTHTLSPRLKFVATARNVLRTMHSLTVESTPLLRNDTLWRPHDDTIYVGLNYKLGALPPPPPH